MGVPVRAGHADGARHHPPRQPSDAGGASSGRLPGGEGCLRHDARKALVIDLSVDKNKNFSPHGAKGTRALGWAPG